ncbi:MAG: phospholipase A [Arenicellales bacterium]
MAQHSSKTFKTVSSLLIQSYTSLRARIFAGCLVVISHPTIADDYADCLIKAISSAADTDTVQMIRSQCTDLRDTAEQTTSAAPAPKPGLIERRLRLEQEASSNRFAIVQHRSSYILPVTYNSRVNNAPFDEIEEGRELDNYEFKFQFSIKAQLFDSIMKYPGRIYFGYTNQSYWQIYDQENSGPFRETNHEPEIFADFNRDTQFAGWHIPMMRLGWVHQSNGRSSSLSRSWNRLYGQVFLEKNNWALSIKPWIRVSGDSAEEDNPDIDDYMGNFEFGIFRQGVSSAASARIRNNLRSENRGAIELNWSKPLPYNKKLRFYLQYFYGYGESLIDYNAITNRIGLGLQLSDFL